MKKVIVAHPGKQHSLQLAAGIKKKGYELLYCTTVYEKPHSLTTFAEHFLGETNKEKAHTRRSDKLNDSEIYQFCEAFGLWQLLLQRCKCSRFLRTICEHKLLDTFDKRVLSLSEKRKADMVVSFDTNSAGLFMNLKKRRPSVIRVLDMAAANRLYMKRVYQHDYQVMPDFAKKLRSESPILQSKNVEEQIKQEIGLAQFFLVGSSFVKKTLVFSGIPEKRIYICPYGVDTSIFSCNKDVNSKAKKSSKVHFIFVGGTKEIKGISYLLSAFQKIDHGKATLTVVGVNTLPQKLLNKYGTDVQFTGMVLHERVAEILKGNDVMVFPSLGDGFGLSVIEGLACGLPVICSTNTGAAEYIQDGENGFIVPIQNSYAITQKMQWFIDHKNKLHYMSEQAKKTALKLTWDNYYTAVGNAVEDIFKHESGNAAKKYNSEEK